MAELHVLSMGWGVQTWTLAAMMALDEHPRADYIIFADTEHEGIETYRFIRTWEPWLGEHGLTVVTVRGKRTDVVREDWGTGSVLIPAFTVDVLTGKEGQVRRQCTHDWKIMPIRGFVRQQLQLRNIRRAPGVVESWQGISWDEWRRMRTSDVKYIENQYPLVDRRMTRADCVAWLDLHGLPTPHRSNCTFCPFTSIAGWRELKRQAGPDWQEAVAVDESIRGRRPMFQLFIHPARAALPRAIQIPEDYGAQQLSFDELCDGGHCGV